MDLRKILFVAVSAASIALATGASASVETNWERHHPRREQVIDRLHNQDLRIRDERMEGGLTAMQARHIHREDRAMFRQEQRFARMNGGHITKAEQHKLNREENRVSNQIGR